MPRARRFLSIILASAVSSAVLAQTLGDPTRPPAALADPNAAVADAVPAGPQLQSVMLPKGGRARALISGEWVELGGNYGDSRLVRITADRVEMAGPQGRETLRMTPDVERQAVVKKRSGKDMQGITR